MFGIDRAGVDDGDLVDAHKVGVGAFTGGRARHHDAPEQGAQRPGDTGDDLLPYYFGLVGHCVHAPETHFSFLWGQLR